MARPNKTGLDYFPMDVNTDYKFELIEAKHGLIGFAIVVKLYQVIYKAGYFTLWNEEMLLLFKKSVNVEIEVIEAIIADCFKYSILDKNLYQDYSILTSAGIQKRYLAACERRKVVELTRKFVVVDINQFNVRINWIDENSNTQEEPIPESPKTDNSGAKPKSEKVKVADLSSIPINFQPIVEEWLDYKKSRKESYKSDQSIKAFNKKLFDMSGGVPEVAKKIIEQSMANNWAGIFQLKENYGKNWRTTESERRKEAIIAEAVAISGRAN